MNVKEALARLQELGDEKMRAQNAKRGAGDNQFGVRLGYIRKVAKDAKKNHDLALELWETGNIDARLLAVLIMKPKALTAEELDGLVRSVDFVQVADWLNAYVVKHHPDKESLRKSWMTAEDPMAARAGWNLTAERVERDADGLDLDELLDRIEGELVDADPEPQWTMNNTLAMIRNSRPRSSYPGTGYWRKAGRISGVPGLQGLHIPVRSRLDQRDGQSSQLTATSDRPEGTRQAFPATLS